MAEQSAVMTFREHLGELRDRLVRIAIILLIGFGIGWEFRREIFAFLSGPITEALADNGIYHYQAISVTESIIVYLKAVFIADLVVLSPLVFYQVWAFIGPGLLNKEKDFVLPLTFFSVVFFLIGGAFSYQVIVPFVTDFLTRMTVEDGSIEMLVTMQNAFSTSFTFLLMFGLVFELPLVIYFLALFGAVTPKSLIKFYRYFIVLSFIAGAMLTPPDPISQALMAIPLNILYGFGILVAWAVVRTREKIEESEASGDETESERRVGAESMRMLGAGLALMLVATALIIGFIQTLPALKLDRMAPPTTQWMVGYNPEVSKGHEPFDGLMASTMGTDSPSVVFEKAGLEALEIRHVLILGNGEERAVLVRADGLGAYFEAILDALQTQAGKQPPPVPIGAVLIDENTVAIGQERFVGSIWEVSSGQAAGYEPNEFEERLVARLKASGPVWAWVPEPGVRGKALLGDRIITNVAAIGAWLKGGTSPSVTLELRARDALRADMVEALLEQERVVTSQTHGSKEVGALTQAVRELIVEIREDAAPARKRRLSKIMTALAIERPGATDAAVPVMGRLASVIRGWAIRRNDEWLHLTSEIRPDGFKAFWTDVLTQPGSDG